MPAILRRQAAIQEIVVGRLDVGVILLIGDAGYTDRLRPGIRQVDLIAALKAVVHLGLQRIIVIVGDRSDQRGCRRALAVNGAIEGTARVTAAIPRSTT